MDALGRVERGHVRREIDGFYLGAYRVVERRVLARRDLSEPVAAPPALPAGEQPVEQMMRRGVDDDPGQVLAAHEVHVVDAQVGGDDFVARRAM